MGVGRLRAWGGRLVGQGGACPTQLLQQTAHAAAARCEPLHTACVAQGACCWPVITTGMLVDSPACFWRMLRDAMAAFLLLSVPPHADQTDCAALPDLAARRHRPRCAAFIVSVGCTKTWWLGPHRSSNLDGCCMCCEVAAASSGCMYRAGRC